MNRWPLSAWVALLAQTICFSIVTYIVYDQARFSYRAVGFNDGIIETQEKLRQVIEGSAAVSDCSSVVPDGHRRTELIIVKSLGLLMETADGVSFRFCRYPSGS